MLQYLIGKEISKICLYLIVLPLEKSYKWLRIKHCYSKEKFIYNDNNIKAQYNT